MRKSKKRTFSISKSVIGLEVTLELSGPVDAAASAVLGSECATLFEASFRITLDLAKVPSTDGVGLTLLIALRQFGTTLTNVPTGITRQIESKHRRASWR